MRMLGRGGIVGVLALATGLSLAGCFRQTVAVAPSPSPIASTESPASTEGTITSDDTGKTFPDGIETLDDGRTRVTVNGKTIYADSAGSIEINNDTVIVNGKVVSSDGKTDASGGDTVSVTRSVQQQAATAGIHRLHLQTNYGSITAIPASDNQVTVTAKITFGDIHLSAAQKKKYIAAFVLQTDRSGTTLTPHVVPPKNFPKNMRYPVSYQVAVPATLDWDMKSDNGAVFVNDTHTRANVRAISEYGSVKVSHAGSNIIAESSNGKVTVACDPGTDKVDAHSEYGAVHVTGTAHSIVAHSANGVVTVNGANTATEVEAESEYGAIHLTDCAGDIVGKSQNGSVEFSGKPKRLTLKSEYGRVHATINDAANLAQTELKSENGMVAMELPKGVSVMLDAQTENGNIALDNVPGIVEKDGVQKYYHQSLGGGSIPVRLFTEYGRIAIRRR